MAHEECEKLNKNRIFSYGCSKINFIEILQ
jgi:hypothetical protein